MNLLGSTQSWLTQFWSNLVKLVQLTLGQQNFGQLNFGQLYFGQLIFGQLNICQLNFVQFNLGSFGQTWSSLFSSNLVNSVLLKLVQSWSNLVKYG